jgi:hypothetical protein
MHVNISSLFNESGVISVNFTIKGMPKQSDILKATFMLTFSECKDFNYCIVYTYQHLYRS